LLAGGLLSVTMLAWPGRVEAGPNLVAIQNFNHPDQLADVTSGYDGKSAYYRFSGEGDFGWVEVKSTEPIGTVKRDIQVRYVELSKEGSGGQRGLLIDTKEARGGNLEISAWFRLNGKVRPKKEYEYNVVAVVAGSEQNAKTGFKLVAPAVWADGEPLGAEVDLVFDGRPVSHTGAIRVQNFEKQTGAAHMVLKLPSSFNEQLLIMRMSLREVDENLLAGKRPKMPVPIRYVSIADPLEFRIAEAINGLGETLLNLQNRDGSWNAGSQGQSVQFTAVAAGGLALSGQSTKEGPVARALDWMAAQLPEELVDGTDNPEKKRERDFRETGAHESRLWCMSRFGDPEKPKHRQVIAHDMSWLIAAQMKDGGWSELHKDDPEARVLHSNNSISASVVSSLKEAYFAGWPCPRKVWTDAGRYFVDAQANDKGFRFMKDEYGGVSQVSTVGWTAAGTAAMISTLDMAFASDGKSCQQYRRNPRQLGATRDAMGWLSSEYERNTKRIMDVGWSPNQQDIALEYMVAGGFRPYEKAYYLQQFSEVSGIHALGSLNPARHETRFILDYLYNREGKTMRYGGTPADAATLFILCGVDQPVVVQRINAGGDYVDNLARDGEHLARYLSHDRKSPMSWLNADWDRPMSEFAKVPITYINFIGPCDWTKDDWSKLRNYCYAGGVVAINFSEAAQEVRDAVESGLRETFPESPLTTLAEDDPVLSLKKEVKLDSMPSVVGNGLKNFVYLLPEDWSCTLHTFDLEAGAGRLDFFVNLLELTSEGNLLASSFRPSTWEQAAEGMFHTPVVMEHAQVGADLAGFPDFVKTVDRTMRANYRTAVVPLEEAKGKKATLLWVADLGEEALTPEQAKRIREAMDEGTFVVAEVVSGRRNWGEAFKAEIAKLDGKVELRKLHTSHPIFTGRIEQTQGYDVQRVNLSKALQKDYGEAGKCDLYAIELNGEEVGVLSLYDLSSGLSAFRYPDRRGPETEAARQLVQNIVLRAMELQLD
jgi:hypothetical protein